jgi:hypothetical protein
MSSVARKIVAKNGASSSAKKPAVSWEKERGSSAHIRRLAPLKGNW